jgi:hypothetical protein
LKDEEDVQAYAMLMEQKITEETRIIGIHISHKNATII